jgi:hypothetical protein
MVMNLGSIYNKRDLCSSQLQKTNQSKSRGHSDRCRYNYKYFPEPQAWNTVAYQVKFPSLWNCRTPKKNTRFASVVFGWHGHKHESCTQTRGTGLWRVTWREGQQIGIFSCIQWQEILHKQEMELFKLSHYWKCRLDWRKMSIDDFPLGLWERKLFLVCLLWLFIVHKELLMQGSCLWKYLFFKSPLSLSLPRLFQKSGVTKESWGIYGKDQETTQ